MIFHARDCATALLFARKRNWQKVEEVCNKSLGENPDALAQIYLLVKLSSAKHARIGPVRAFEILNQALAIVQRLPIFGSKAESYVLSRFRLKSGNPRSRYARIGGVDFAVRPESRGRLQLVGLITDGEVVRRTSRVPILLAGCQVGVALVHPIQTSQQPPPGGYFELALTRKLLSGLGRDGSVAVEVDGRTIELPREFFGSFWPHRAEQQPPDSETTIQAIKEGRILSKGGSLIVPRNRDAQWMHPTFSLYTRARQWFKEHLGYELYLVGGTLLGFARERDVIAFDKDFDSGYVSKQENVGGIRLEFKKIIVTLLKAGEDIRLLSAGGKVRRDYFMWHGEHGEHIDVFPASLIGGRYRRPTFVDTDLIESDLYPMRVEQLRGVEVTVPRNCEKKVAAVYGANWRHPDPHWKKVRTPAIIEFRNQIMLSFEDLWEIAQLSEREGNTLLRMIESGDCPTQY